jgi:hypothetical protein
MQNDASADWRRPVRRIRRTLSLRFCLSLGAALAVTSVLLTHRTAPSPDLAGGGIVFVYFPSLCAEPGNAKDCREIPAPTRPSFDSMAACSAHANAQLKQEHDPRLMGSCLMQREG